MIPNKSASRNSDRRSVARLVSPLVLLLIVCGLWHGPATLTKMPVGGDVGTFFLPLMHSYQNALEHGQSLQWNHKWGYGFPQLAESQTGVFYPAHRLIFPLLPLELAYVLNHLLHVAWAALGAYTCARVLGIPLWGSVVAGLVYAGNGFFVSHQAHQWAYTAASWLPWLVALLVRIAPLSCTGDNLGRSVCALVFPLAMAVQLLAGHFQIAFYSVLALVLTLAALRQLSLRSAGLLCLLVASGAGLAAVQLAPTARLAWFTGGPGGSETYAFEFGVPPVHLILGLVLPSAFHVVPAWRPLAWDIYRTSPEEVLTFVGWTPLVLLALGCRSSNHQARRLGLTLAAAGLLLMAAPFIPGLRFVLLLPGFSWFRATSRAMSVAGLGMALLAGTGFEAARDDFRWRWVRWLHAALCTLAVAGGALVYALSGGLGPGLEVQLRNAWIGVARACSPWPVKEADAVQEGSPYPSAPLERLAAAFEQEASPLVRQQASVKVRPRDVLRYELIPWLVGFGASILLCHVLGRRQRLRFGTLIVLIAAELWGGHLLSPVFFAPRSDLLANSPVLEELRSSGPGLSRTVGLAGNTALLGNAAPLPGYRTLDLPVRWVLPVGREDAVSEQLLAIAGVQHEVFEIPRGAVQRVLLRGGQRRMVRPLDDPMVQRLMYGVTDPDRVFLVRTTRDSAPAWFFPTEEPNPPERPGAWVRLPRLPVEPRFSEDGLWVTLRFNATSAGWLLWTAPYYPAWKAMGKLGAQAIDLPLEKTAEGWMALRIPRKGEWEVVLTYSDWAAVAGTAITGLSMAGWVVAAVWLLLRPRACRSAKRNAEAA